MTTIKTSSLFVRLSETDLNGLARAKYVIEELFGTGTGFVYTERRGEYLQYNDPDDIKTPTVFLVYPTEGAAKNIYVEIAGWITRDEFMNRAKAYNGQKIRVSPYDLNSMLDPRIHQVKHGS